jgi:hypothetical protein
MGNLNRKSCHLVTVVETSERLRIETALGFNTQELSDAESAVTGGCPLRVKS